MGGTAPPREPRSLFGGELGFRLQPVLDVVAVCAATREVELVRSLGDLLIVGLNTDESVRSLDKSPNRPVNPLEDRAEVVGGLRSVDAVVSFPEATPEAIIAALKPEVHVKGGDYRTEDLPESKIVQGYGGQVVILPTLEGRSTTSMLKKLGVE